MSRKPGAAASAATPTTASKRFTESISFDQRLYRQDIIASQAHARMLADVGLLTADEAEQIVRRPRRHPGRDRTRRVRRTRSSSKTSTRTSNRPSSSDSATSAASCTPAAAATIRSSPTSSSGCATAIDVIDLRLLELQRALLSNAERHHDLIIPGYTHLQRAQPVLAAHYFLAYVEKYQRDRERLGRLPQARQRAAARRGGAGRHVVADRSRDRAAAARLRRRGGQQPRRLQRSRFRAGVRLRSVADRPASGGWAEEWILWSTTEFNFLDLPDAFCTGSSIMPHKKNPDVLELIRGKSARVAAALQQLVMLVKGLPLAYNRDLQEDKEALFDAFDTVSASLELAAALVRDTKFRREVIARPHRGRLSRCDDVDGVLRQARRAAALGSRSGRQAGAPVRGTQLPARRLPPRSYRRDSARLERVGHAGARRQECAGGVSELSARRRRRRWQCNWRRGAGGWREHGRLRRG